MQVHLLLIFLVSLTIGPTNAQFTLSDWTELTPLTLPGTPDDISTKENADLWISICNDNLFTYQPVGRLAAGWQDRNFQAQSIAACLDGWAFAVQSNGQIYQYNPDADSWTAIVGPNGQTTGALVQISCANQNLAFGRSGDGNLWLYDTGSWNQLQGGGAIWVAIGDQDERWHIGSYNDLYYWDNANGVWHRYGQIPNADAAKTIDVNGPSRIVVTTQSNQLFLGQSTGTWYNFQSLQTNSLRATVNNNTVYSITPDYRVVASTITVTSC